MEVRNVLEKESRAYRSQFRYGGEDYMVFIRQLVG